MTVIPKNDAMLFDVQYIRENRKEGTPDILYLIWKDLNTEEKHLTTITQPNVDIYFEKPEYRNHRYPYNHTYLDRVIKTTVPYTKIINAIIEDGGEAAKAEANAIFRERRYSDLSEFLKYRYVYGADYDIRPLYRYKWHTTYHNEKEKPLRIGFMDIETDFMAVDGISDPKTCPIDLVTLIDGTSKECFTFALVGREYVERDMSRMNQSQRDKELYRRKLAKQRREQEEYLISHQEEMKEELHRRFDEDYGEDMKFKFFFYKDEAKMLVHIFEHINKIKYDFVTFWNFEFDVNYIYERAKVLGIDPKTLFCHPDFPIQECYFKKDRFHFDIKSKTDFFYASSYTIYNCQMRTYAATRKGRSELRSNSLNYVSKKELGDSKEDYTQEGSIKYFGYKNYWKYFIYNIKDVLLQYGIERRTGDLKNYYVTSYQNITPFDSVFKQTVKLRNYQYLDFLSRGMVPGENQNITPFNARSIEEDDEDDEFDFDNIGKKKKKNKKGYEGALVANPILNLNVGAPLYGGKPTNNIFNDAIDMDMAAFYPNTIAAMNIDPSCLHFKVILSANQFDIAGGELPIHTMSHIPLIPDEASDFHDDVAKECFDNYQTHNYLSTGHKWFNLPSIDDLYYACKKKIA